MYYFLCWLKLFVKLLKDFEGVAAVLVMIERLGSSALQFNEKLLIAEYFMQLKTRE